MTEIELLINARWVIPVDPDGCLGHHSIAIDQGRILEVLPTAAAAGRYTANETVDLTTHALIPGLINAHTHAAMVLFRGLADDLPLMDWLQNHIWPAEGHWVSSQFVSDGAQLAVAEMLKSGTTCFSDMYFFPEECARVARKAGIRACLGMIVIDFPTVYAGSPAEYLDKGLRLHDDLRGSELTTVAFAPHAPYSVSDEPLARIRTLNDELGLPVHMHIHETAHEVQDALAQTGRRPLDRLRDLDLLGPHLIAVHMTQLLSEDIALLAQTGVSVVHCPESNLKLASGFCPVHELLRAGVNVALGTDGAASNNDLDMLDEMRVAALLAKAVSGDATALPARQALRMATLNGARALGLESVTGSISSGKYADLAAIDLARLPSQPIYDPLSQIVYTASRDQVTDVWVAGRQLLRRGHLTSLDESEILQRARTWSDRIRERPGP
ncbi:MAG: TRZ/ATZ family hydrolase [Gammaproteobacteria bacterium]|nr:TRZ/ATZ family hydrolase [Gammaproteobacteria bacterium]